MTEYIVEAKSRKDLRELATIIRAYWHLQDQLWVPIVGLLVFFADHFPGFSYEIVSDDELPPETHADTDVRTGHIRIKESVYLRACNNEGRDRMTIAHEIGHYLTLYLCGFTLQRNFKNEKVKPFQDPEWQAKCFAGEFMIPYYLTENMTVEEIVKACGVSHDAAVYQLTHR